MENWISVTKQLPDKHGQYWCRNKNGCEFPAILTKKLSGEKTWLTLPGLEVHEWKPIKPQP